MCATPVFADEYVQFSFEDAVHSFSEGKSAISADELWQEVWKHLMAQVRENIGVMLTVFGICAFYALLSSLEIGFGKNNVSQVAFFVLYMTVVGLCLTAFRDIADEGKNIIETLTLTQNTVVPLMGTAIISSGGFGVYSALAPVILVMSNVASNVVNLVGMPAVFASLAINVAGNISPDFHLGALASLIRKSAFWAVTAVMTVFCALVGVSGIGSGAINGAALKALKFAAGSMIPVLGSVMSDSVEAVASGAAALKSAVGAAGMIFIVIRTLFPVLKIAVVVFIYKLTAVLVGIFADKRITNVLDGMAQSLGAIAGFAISISAAMMISLSILIRASDMGVM